MRGSPFGSPRDVLAADFEKKHPLTRKFVRPSGFEPETCGFENGSAGDQVFDVEGLFRYPFS
jgi:hypothetical protein